MEMIDLEDMTVSENKTGLFSVPCPSLSFPEVS